MRSKGAPSAHAKRAFLPEVFQVKLAWERFDWHTLLLALVLFATGLVFQRALADADELYRGGGLDFHEHVVKALFAVPFFLAGLCVRPRWLRRRAWVLYGLALLLLIAVLVPGIGELRNNAQRWIEIPGSGFDLQPSELAKIALVLALARALYRNRLEQPSDYVWPALVALVPMALVMKQPDLGTALTFVPISLGLLHLAGARARILLGSVLGIAVLAALAWRFEWIHDYQLRRIDTWWGALDPLTLIDNRNGAAYHTYQARVAIGNGGLFGTGLGAGVANLAGHLPERDCDSIFAVIAEESGFVGATALLLLYGAFVGLILYSASGLRERFARLAVGGLGLYFAAHLFVNCAVNLGLVPLTGLTLPLFSTGGSSLATSFLAVGLALGLACQSEPALDEDSFRG